MVKAGDGEPFCLTLGGGVGYLWWFSGNDEDAYEGGDPHRSSVGSWFSMDGEELVRW
jgi:hypothetical protein